MSKTNIDRQLRKLEITEDLQVKATFVEILNVAPSHPENESTIIDNEYSVKSRHVPHGDLLNVLKKLKAHALEICELEIPDAKKKGDYQVSGVKISGDVLLQQSRVVFTISKKINRTGKIVKITTPQTTMYGESEYAEAEKMSAIVEDLIEEVFLYLGGKYEAAGQLPLFSPLQLEAL
jgi:hypothetical protein